MNMQTKVAANLPTEGGGHWSDIEMRTRLSSTEWEALQETTGTFSRGLETKESGGTP